MPELMEPYRFDMLLRYLSLTNRTKFFFASFLRSFFPMAVRVILLFLDENVIIEPHLVVPLIVFFLFIFTLYVRADLRPTRSGCGMG